MKVCADCYRINFDDAEECVGCGFTNFQDVIPVEEELPPPFYNSAEEYKEAIDEERCKESKRSTEG